MTTQSKNLTREEADAFGRELDALRPESPNRASHVPGPPCRALPGDGAARARDLCALRTKLQHGEFRAPVEQRDRPKRAAVAARAQAGGEDDARGAERACSPIDLPRGRMMHCASSSNNKRRMP